MLTFPTIEELRELMEQSNDPSVSIYLPTLRVATTPEDQIRFKNLLGEAEARLIQYGLRSPVARKLLDPANRLLQNPGFWKHQEEGLAVFLSSRGLRHYCLPVKFNELVAVADRFHLKPLIPVFTDDLKFFILAVGQNEVRLLESTRYFAGEVTPQEMPRSLAEALQYDQPEKQLQIHTAEQGSQAIFHGHGVSKDDDKVNLLRFFQQIDRGLHELLREEQAPLVVAAVDYLHPIYRQANTYAHLLNEGIKGNPEALTEKELREQAWNITRSLLEGRRKEALALYREASAKGQAADAPETIVFSAIDGRVSLLFVAVDRQLWGKIDPARRQIELLEEQEAGALDLLDFAAIHTLTRRGLVYGMEAGEISGKSLMAALLRY